MADLDEPIIAEQLDVARLALAEKAMLQDDKMTGCTSYVQRRVQCGYNRAGLLLERLVEQGFITEPDIMGARKLL
jgi:DNA segregation ATPase FtsK/SpoIIIE-like protein